MLRNLFTIVLLLLCTHTYAADRDTVWKKFDNYPCIRAELGWNAPWFASVGFSYFMFTRGGSGRGAGIASIISYLSGDVHFGTTYKDGTTFYGYKTGVELMVNTGIYAFEIKSLTDFSSGITQTYVTPKIGLGLGFVNVLYGYNTFRKWKNTYDIGRHQVALSINFSPKMIKELKE